MPEDKINFKLILDNCRKGDRNSQRILYEHYYGYGMSICQRYAKNELEAAEMFNDAFLKIFTYLEQYRPELHFKSWIRKIFINASIDYYRKHRKDLLLVDLDQAGEIPDDFAVPIKVEPEEDILPVIQQLSPMYRMVFNLYVMEQYKHHEIAELLGITVSTSKSNLLRARKRLMELLIGKDAKQIEHG